MKQEYGVPIILCVIAALCASLSACRLFIVGGTYPEAAEPPARVSLSDLSRYYQEQSGGLLQPSAKDTGQAERTLKFTWDPYDKQRILAPFFLKFDAVQDLFTFDMDAFVRREGTRDVLSASYRLFNSLPFNQKKQTYVRPYRCLAAWGSLVYPPVKTLAHPPSFYHAGFSEGYDAKDEESLYFDPQFQMQLDDETQTELTYGNRLRALFNGVESFPEKLRLAATAKRFLYVAVMTIVADSSGRELIRLMVRKHREGVDVRLITEDFYTFSISNYAIGVLEREGIPVAHVADKRLNQIDRMFHDKFWIRDGEEAVLGGMNVLDYEDFSDGFNFLNRDSDILIQGPAVTDLLGRYVALWKRYDKRARAIATAESVVVRNKNLEREEGVRGRENYSRWLRDPATRMNGICRTAVQGDNAEPQRIITLLTRYLQAARHSFYMTSPEVEFDLESRDPQPIDSLALVMRDKLSDSTFYEAYITNGSDGGLGESNAFLRSRVEDAKLVGEPLWEDMLTPIVDDQGRDVNRRVRATLRPLIAAGLHGFQHFNYMHAKQFYFDRILVGIGSWNFDHFSASNNHECAVFCLDDSLCKQMEVQLAKDMVNSIPVILQGTLAPWNSLPPEP
jgi:phosphatidylserine/phosphatidylglycerophosphate/cardiolipin synthase-like enzyme